MSIEQNKDSMHIDRKEQGFGLLFLLLFLIAAVRLAWMQPIESVTPYFAGFRCIFISMARYLRDLNRKYKLAVMAVLMPSCRDFLIFLWRFL